MSGEFAERVAAGRPTGANTVAPQAATSNCFAAENIVIRIVSRPMAPPRPLRAAMHVQRIAGEEQCR